MTVRPSPRRTTVLIRCFGEVRRDLRASDFGVDQGGPAYDLTISEPIRLRCVERRGRNDERHALALVQIDSKCARAEQVLGVIEAASRFLAELEATIPVRSAFDGCALVSDEHRRHSLEGIEPRAVPAVIDDRSGASALASEGVIVAVQRSGRTSSIPEREGGVGPLASSSYCTTVAFEPDTMKVERSRSAGPRSYVAIGNGSSRKRTSRE